MSALLAFVPEPGERSTGFQGSDEIHLCIDRHLQSNRQERDSQLSEGYDIHRSSVVVHRR